MNDMNEILSQREAEAAQDPGTAYNPNAPFQIYIQNKVTQEKHAIYVLNENNMGQILEAYGSKIGIKPGKKVLFFNKRTGQQANGPEDTVRSIGLCAEDILQITDDGSVAAE